MGKIDFNLRYSKKLPPINDFLINRNTLFKAALKELKPKKEDKVLEIGCDRGYFVNFLQKNLNKDNIFGIDLNKGAISLSMTDNLFLMDATETIFPNKYFDKIYSFHVIEHISDLKKFFREVDRILNKKGIVVLGYPWELFRGMMALRHSIKIYKNPFMARKLHIHKLNPKKIKKYLKSTSLKHKKSLLLFALLPQYLTVLEKK